MVKTDGVGMNGVIGGDYRDGAYLSGCHRRGLLSLVLGCACNKRESYDMQEVFDGDGKA